MNSDACPELTLAWLELCCSGEGHDCRLMGGSRESQEKSFDSLTTRASFAGLRDSHSVVLPIVHEVLHHAHLLRSRTVCVAHLVDALSLAQA